jgi:hypothetical protein
VLGRFAAREKPKQKKNNDPVTQLANNLGRLAAYVEKSNIQRCNHSLVTVVDFHLTNDGFKSICKKQHFAASF